MYCRSSIFARERAAFARRRSCRVEVGEGFALEVANPCSGIRSLFSLTMVGALFGYLTLRKRWQWMAICASAIPLAVVGNAVRILLLLAGSKLFGSEFAVGVDGGTSLFHLFAGIAVFSSHSVAWEFWSVSCARWDRPQSRDAVMSPAEELGPSKAPVILEAG